MQVTNTGCVCLWAQDIVKPESTRLGQRIPKIWRTRANRVICVMIGEMSSSDWIITDSHLVLFMRKVSARNGPFESRLWERIYAKITKRKTLNWRWGKSSRSRPIWVRRFQPQWNRIDETCFRHDVCKNVWKTYFLRTLLMSWQNCFYGAFGVSEFTIDLQKGMEFNKSGNSSKCLPNFFSFSSKLWRFWKECQE